MTLPLEIFWVFFKISFISIGGVFGVLPELERMVVGQYGWLTHDQFIQSYTLAQFVPGPNMAMCPLIGYWVAGWPGWIAGFLGIYLPPLIMMGVAYTSYRRYKKNETLKRIEIALRPLVLGTLAASATHLWWVQTVNLRFFSLLLSVIGIYIYAKKYLHPIPMIFAFGFVWWLGAEFLL
jgi:chromate transporter